MSRRYRIGILICVVILCVAYGVSYHPKADKLQPQPTQSTEEIKTLTVGSSKDEQVFQYFLKVKHGYVYVYLSDQVTLYETTTIRIRYLPEKLQQELREGKPLKDDHELYNFLENYSS